MGILGKIKEVGLRNTLVGFFKREKYIKLQKQYGFDSWHISPYELRGYAQATAEYINTHGICENEVVDIGCGLGEIIRNIKAEKRFGMDPDELVIECAKTLDKSKSITFNMGALDELGTGRNIDYAIALGFTHGSGEEVWRKAFGKICGNNDIKNVVVDVFPAGFDGAIQLDFSRILPEGYQLKDRLGPFLGGKYLEIYSKE